MWPEIQSLLHEPAVLGLGLGLFGLLWVSTAALLSVLFPPRPRGASRRAIHHAPSPVSTDLPKVPSLSSREISLSLVRQRFDGAYFDLLKRVESLEKHAPSSSGMTVDAQRLDEKTNRLWNEIEVLRGSLEKAHSWGQVRGGLEGRIDELTRKAQGLLAVLESTAPSSSPVESHSAAERLQYKSLMEDSRRQQVEFRRQKEFFVGERERRYAEAAQELQALKQALQQTSGPSSAPEWERSAVEKRLAELERQRLEFQTERESAPPFPFTDVREGNEQLRVRRESEKKALQEERERHQKRLTRLESRLAAWKRAWEARLGTEKDSWSEKLSALLDEKNKVEALLKREKEQREEEARNLRVEEDGLRVEQERFQKQEVEPWRLEQAERRRAWDGLRSESQTLEREIQSLQEQKAYEQERFGKAMGDVLRSVRDQQTHWKSAWRNLQQDGAGEIQRSAEELSRLQKDRETEKASQGESLAARRKAWDESEKGWQRQKFEWEARTAEEKQQWARKLADASDAASELRKRREAVAGVLEEERRESALRLSERRDWAEKRFRTLQEALRQIQERAHAHLARLKEEKDAVRAVLEQERAGLRETVSRWEKDFQAKHAEVEAAHRQAEKERDDFVSEVTAEEEGLRREMARLQESVDALEKQAASFRAKNERRMRHRKERYEKLLLGLEQRTDQERVSAEARLAQGRMGLESLENRLARRRERLDRIRRRRQEGLQAVFEEAQNTLEVVRQHYWFETRSWLERLTQSRAQRQALEEKKAQLKEAPETILEELRAKDKETAERYGQEKARLLKEAEDYWNGFLEKSSNHQRAMRDALSALANFDNDLSRQEAAAQEFLATVKNQLAQLKDLRQKFGSTAKDSQIPISGSSVA
ncbi:MAG: hypothetical protein HY548_07125 [Elusimicrobia bacterium]|nr:hypothetical protein [Elusimicrobiota bacterium]